MFIRETFVLIIGLIILMMENVGEFLVIQAALRSMRGKTSGGFLKLQMRPIRPPSDVNN